MMDGLSITIITSTVIGALIYAFKETLREYFDQLFSGIMVRGEQISKGCWIDIPEEEISGICVGNNMTNVKIDTGNGIVHILNEKVFRTNLSIINDKNQVLKKMYLKEVSDTAHWSSDTLEITKDY